MMADDNYCEDLAILAEHAGHGCSLDRTRIRNPFADIPEEDLLTITVKRWLPGDSDA